MSTQEWAVFSTRTGKQLPARCDTQADAEHAATLLPGLAIIKTRTVNAGTTAEWTTPGGDNQ